MAEIVTIEHNGEVFDVEVPDGTPDSKVLDFVKQQGSSSAAAPVEQPGITGMLQAPPQAQDYAIPQAAMSAARPAAEAALGAGKFGVESVKNVADIGRNMLNWTPEAWKQVVSHPIESAKAYVQTMPAFAGAPGTTTGQMVRGGIGQMAGAAGRAMGGMVAAPENLFTLPYTMAAYEQDKIRANPQAPGLEYNPFAQQVRGEFPTQGAAAASNRRQAIRGQQYGGLSPEEQQMLRQDRELNYAMRLKAAKKVLGQP